MKDRNRFIKQMISLGFISKDDAPSEECKEKFPDLRSPTQEVVDKTVFIFHDESAFQANENQMSYWGESSDVTIQPKSKGSAMFPIS